LAVVNGTIAAYQDDAMTWDASGYDFDNNSSTAWFGNSGDLPELVMLRFTLGAAIPSGATITTTAGATAISCYGTNASAIGVAHVYVTESANGAQVTTAAGRPSWAGTPGGSTTTYPTTEEGAGVVEWTGTWNLVAWNVINVGGLVQHLVDTYSGLANGSHIVFWIDGDRDEGTSDENGMATGDSGGMTNVATLQITYTTGGATNVVYMIFES
jgi:hypothetical protein